MKTSSSFKLSDFALPLNKFPITGTFPIPGVCFLLSVILSFLIPPITTMSPSANNNLVSIWVGLHQRREQQLVLPERDF